MKYLATALTLTLGAWRLRISFDLEDAPNEHAAASQRTRGLARHESLR